MPYTRVDQPVTSPTILTYKDAIDHLVDYSDGLTQEGEQRRIKRAVQQAYRDVAAYHDWRYLQAHKRISLDAYYATGTVVYTHATKSLVLTSGTWPTWAADGCLKIGTAFPVYKVASRTSNSTIVLATDFNPGANVASTTYTLFRTQYPLPADMVRLDEINDEEGWWGSTYVSPNDWLNLERHNFQSASSFLWTIMGASGYIGQSAVYIWGYPTTAKTLDFIYTRRPRPLKLNGYDTYSSYNSGQTLSTGAVSTTTVGFTGLTTKADMIGAVIRLARSGATAPPEGQEGSNPWLMQKMITATPTSSTVTVDSALEYAKESTHFSISDPVDLPEYLLNPFYRRMEYQWNLKVRPEKAALSKAAFDEAILQAMAQDAMTPEIKALMPGWTAIHSPLWSLSEGNVSL